MPSCTCGCNHCMKLHETIKELRQALTGRTVSCSQCEQSGKEVEQLREVLEKIREQAKDAIYYKCALDVIVQWCDEALAAGEEE